jgi:hypothetical protein
VGARAAAGSPAIDRLIESISETEGLAVTMKGALRAYPTSVHRHFKKGSGRGTIEVTWWRSAGRIWFTVDRGRSAPWIRMTVRRMRAALERRLG